MRDLHDLLIAGRILGGNDSPELITKTVTENGTYSAASDNADGYSAVTVAVPELPVTFLKSIKSVGNSIIVTDIVPAYDDAAYVDMKAENLSTISGLSDIFFGIRKTSEHYLMTLSAGSNWSSFTAVSGFTAGGGDVFSVSNVTGELGVKQCAIIRRGNKNCIFGTKSFNMTVKTTDTTPTSPISISGFVNDNDEPIPYAKADLTIYGITMLNSSGVTLHNLVPAKSKTTNRAGLYDLVTGKFYQSHMNFDDFIMEV